jgi:hypothetical protein
MSTNHDDRPDDSDQAGRIEKLREQARQAAGEQMIAWSQMSSRRNNEQFWRRVMDFENAPVMTDDADQRERRRARVRPGMAAHAFIPPVDSRAAGTSYLFV